MTAALGFVVAVQLAATPITLEQVREGARQQLDAVRAELALSQAGADKVTARSSILPHVSLSFGASAYVAGPQRTFSTVPQQQPDGTIDYVQTAVDTPGFDRANYSLSIGLQQLIYDGGQWWNQIAQAGAQEEAAQGQLEEQRLASEVEAVSRFYALLNAQVQLRTLEATIRRSEEQVERAKGLYEAGRATRSAWLDAQTSLGNDRITQLRQKHNLITLRTQLLQWLGRPDEDIEAVAPEGFGEPRPSPAFDEALAVAKRQRPLFRSLEKQLEAADLAVSIARGGYLPRLSGSLSGGRSAPSADPFFTSITKQNTFSAGLNLSWDLFSGFATDAAVERARLSRTRVGREQEQTRLDLEAELRRTLDTLATEEQVLELSRANLELARQQEQLETERFAAGASTSLDVRNAELKLTQAELSVDQGRANVAVAREALRRVLGGDT